MSELVYKEEVFQLVGFCMEIHRELGKGHDEIVYKDAFVVELSRAGIPFLREKNYEITYKGVILPHYYYADFVVWDKILFEAKAVEKLADSHIKQVLNYLAAWKLRLGVLVNFGWRLARVEKNCFMRHELHQFARMDLMWFVTIRVQPLNFCDWCARV
jgi:GxxExxY protein